MTEPERIADQLERAFKQDAWHGPALLELLQHVDAKAATLRPVPGGHNILELARHIAFWQDVVRRRLGGEVVDYPDGLDWDGSFDDAETAWRKAQEELVAVHHRLLAAIRQLEPGDLDRIVAGKDYTAYIMLHGVVQHNLYHAGQIAQLRRAAGVR